MVSAVMIIMAVKTTIIKVIIVRTTFTGVIVNIANIVRFRMMTRGIGSLFYVMDYY